MQMRMLVGEKLGIEQLRAECSAIRAWSRSNYLPLLWKHYRSHRKVLLQVLRSLRLETPSTDHTLLRAVAIILENAARRPRYLEPDDLDLTFCSDRRKKLILREIEGGLRIDRRQLEVCVFSYLTAELRSGDVTVWGTESFADHREQLLPLEDCRKLMKAYCEQLNLPTTASEFVAHLKNGLGDIGR